MELLEGINIQRTQRQHSSVVVVIPVAVRRCLGINAGDYVIFASHPGSGVVVFKKFESKEIKHGGNQTNPDRENQGG